MNTMRYPTFATNEILVCSPCVWSPETGDDLRGEILALNFRSHSEPKPHGVTRTHGYTVAIVFGRLIRHGETRKGLFEVKFDTPAKRASLRRAKPEVGEIARFKKPLHLPGQGKFKMGVGSK